LIYEIGLLLELPVADLNVLEILQAAFRFVHDHVHNPSIATQLDRVEQSPASAGIEAPPVVLSPEIFKTVAKIVASGTDASSGRLSVGKFPSLKALISKSD